MNESSCHNVYAPNQEYEFRLGRKSPLTWFHMILLLLFATMIELAVSAPQLAGLHA